MARQPAPPQTPEQKAKTNAQLKIIGGAVVSIIGICLLIWGREAQPGERRNALWLALEEMMGYQGVCWLFIGGGGLAVLYGVWRLMAIKKNPPAA